MATKNAKVLAILSIFLFCFVFASYADGIIQLNSPAEANRRAVSTKFSIGIYGGTNYSKLYLPESSFFISDTYIPKTEFNFLPTFGLVGIYRANDNWSFQLEYNIEKKGMHYSAFLYRKQQGLQLQSEINNDLKFSYHTIPLITKLHFGRVIKMYLEAGPYFSSMRKVTESGVFKIQEPSPFEPGKIRTVVENFEWDKSAAYQSDFGVIGGMGIIVPLVNGVWGPTTSLHLNLRYSRGLRDIYVGREIEEQNDVEELIGINEDILDPREGSNDIRNSVVTLRFGLIFAI